MFKFSLKSAVWAVALSSLIISCQPADTFQTEPQANDVVRYGTSDGSAKLSGDTQKYIVTFRTDGAINSFLPDDGSSYEVRTERMRALISRLLGGDVADQAEQVYSSSVKGFAGPLTDVQLQILSKFPFIASVEPDQAISVVLPEATGRVTAAAQSTPWGITAVGGPRTYTGSNRAWVIDTGIDYTHPDLNVNTGLSRNFVNTRRNANDDNGHGSHVAGTIGAINNGSGVVGVAPGVQVVAIKVLSSSGSGSTSGVVAGIDYFASAASSGDVANMSLGGGASTAIDNAVLAAVSQSGKALRIAVAAGNESQNANNVSPARVNHPNVYTISAHDINNNFASFSNFANPPVDYAAPGVSVYSTYRSGRYATLSGTSMATPHVAGILLFGTPRVLGTVNNDRDSTPDSRAGLPN